MLTVATIDQLIMMLYYFSNISGSLILGIVSDGPLPAVLDRSDESKAFSEVAGQRIGADLLCIHVTST